MAVKSLRLAALFVVSVAPGAHAAQAEMHMLANPIRKVVTMLQDMQKKVTEEGEKAEELFEKYMCYCKNSGGDLAASIQESKAKVEELGPAVEAAESQKVQLDKDVESHGEEKAAVNKAIDEATAIREKEKAAFDKASADSKTNIAALAKAIQAINNGLGGSFLQTREASVLRTLLANGQTSLDEYRQELLSFLSGGAVPPRSLEIIGVLQEMMDDMKKDDEDMVATEDASVKTYDELLAAKKKEDAALTTAIQEKLDRSGSLGIRIAEMKNDNGDTANQLAQDEAFAADLKKNCAEKGSIHEEEKKMRAEEVVALADTIQILNSDDALELFKKTLPSASSSFLQLQTTAASMRAQARSLVAHARSKVQPGHGAERLDFISLALSGRKVGLEKVVKLVGDLIVTLKQEQQADDDKKQYCTTELDVADDKKKALERSISDLDTGIEETKEGISTLKGEIANLEKGIVALDKSVSEATTQRKAENKEYKELMAGNAAAKEVIVFAKKRLSKFYGSSLLQDGDASAAAPQAPPETMAAYTKKNTGGVVEKMDLLIGDIDKEMTTAETEEKLSQQEYVQTMTDAKEKRALDQKSLGDRQSALADAKSELEASHEDKKSTGKELHSAMGFLSTLHTECDWQLQYYDVRKEARADEVDSLEKAKAVLSGADLPALVQISSSHVRARKFLRHNMV